MNTEIEDPGDSGVEQEMTVELPIEPPPGSTLADGRLHELDPASVDVDTIVSWIGAGMVAIPVTLGALLMWTLAPWPLALKIVLSVAGLLIVCGLALLALKWPPIEHRYTRWRLDSIALEIRRGVVWRAVIDVPISRVQHTDVKQGPIQRRFGLATLVVHTAGSENASVELGGLRRETALELRDALLAHSEEGKS